VPVIQPADPFLDMAGEDLRRRIFLTESETGESLCLRPEFTIPVCLDHIRKGAGTPRRYAYLGTVFRQRREGGNEFLQAGIEDLGEADHAAADARSVADSHALLSALLPATTLHIVIGDQAVFEAVLAALGLPRGWQKRLARAFGSPDLLQAALADLAAPQPAGEEATLPLDDLAALTDRIREEMEASGFSTSAARTPEEIAARLVEKAGLRSIQLPAKALAALKSFLAIRVPLADAPAALRGFASDAGIDIDTAVEAFVRRAVRMKEAGLDGGGILYDAAFGRPLDYYTGLVFEMMAGDGAHPLIGGGRYDRLLTLLGAERPIPGVGFSVWLDRVAELRGPA
jgi:ATP phosphoribosyltransferase regulatory subunit